MNRNPSGAYTVQTVGGETVRAIVPAPLPPVPPLEGLGIVREITGRKRERVFAYEAYVAILNEGAEPL